MSRHHTPKLATTPSGVGGAGIGAAGGGGTGGGGVGKKPHIDASVAANSALSSVHVKSLRRCRTILIKDLDAIDVLDAMTSTASVDGCGGLVLKSESRDVIATIRNREDRMNLLLEQIERSDERTFSVFLSVLRERYRNVFTVLDATIKSLLEHSSDDEGDLIKERAAMDGDAIRRILRDAAQRRRHRVRTSRNDDVIDASRNGSVDSLADDVREGSGGGWGERVGGVGGEEYGRYVDCYVVATRGRLQRESWIKHAGTTAPSLVAQSVESQRSICKDSEINYMAAFTKDVVFKLVDRSSLTHVVGIPEHSKQAYIVDEDCLYSPSKTEAEASAPMDKDLNVSATTTARAQSSSDVLSKSRKSTASVRKRMLGENRSTSVPIAAAFGVLPPPLPPKPKNLPVVLHSNAHSTESNDNKGESVSRGAGKLIAPAPRSVTEAAAAEAHLPPRSLSAAKSPPLPMRQPRSQTSSRPVLPPPTSCTDLSTAGTIETSSPASTIVPEDSTTLNMNGHEAVTSDSSCDDDDEDDISLNYNVNLDEQDEEEDPYETVNPGDLNQATTIAGQNLMTNYERCIPEPGAGDVNQVVILMGHNHAPCSVSQNEIANSADENKDAHTEGLDQPANHIGQNDTPNPDRLLLSENICCINLDADTSSAPSTESSNERAVDIELESNPPTLASFSKSVSAEQIPASNGISSIENLGAVVHSEITHGSAGAPECNGVGRTSPTSEIGLVNAPDSGVDSVVSQAYSDSPQSHDVTACSAATDNIFLSASLGDLKIHASHDDDAGERSSSNYSYYEDIELVDGFLSPSAYLDPRSAKGYMLSRRSLSHATSFRGGADRNLLRQLHPEFNFASPADRKVVPCGTLILIVAQAVSTATTVVNDCSATATVDTHQESECVKETMAVGYDKDGLIYVVPSSTLKRHGDPCEEPWFYPIPISVRDATLFLNRENQKGCFLVYRSIIASTPNVLYNLSVCCGDGRTVHYHIVQNMRGDVMIDGHDHSFMTVGELIEYFRRNQSRLTTRLRRSLKEARLPITPGYHYPRDCELPRNSVQLGGTIIGRGKFGVVCQGLYRGTTVSVKVLQKDSTPIEEDDFIEEALVMMNIVHDNIIQLLGVCCAHRPFYIVTEFFEKGTLQHCLEAGVIPTDNVDVLFDICMQIVSAMAYLESLHYILHRDVRARNFLLADDSLVKLTNFDRARFVTDDDYLAASSCSSGSSEDEIFVQWAAPEVLTESRYSTKSDVWSLGVVFWEVFSHGVEPHAKLSDKHIASFIVSGGHLDKPRGCSHDIYAMMKSCWRLSPDDRPSFATLSDKIKGKASVYYTGYAAKSASVGAATSAAENKPAPPSAAALVRMSLPLPIKAKAQTLAHRPVTSASFGNGGASQVLRSGATLRPDIGSPGATVGEKRVSASSAVYGIPTSSSDSVSVMSVPVANEMEKDDLTRSDRIRKSLRKLIKKKSPSIASSRTYRVN